jgi:hypothetical protein
VKRILIYYGSTVYDVPRAVYVPRTPSSLYFYITRVVLLATGSRREKEMEKRAF